MIQQGIENDHPNPNALDIHHSARKCRAQPVAEDSLRALQRAFSNFPSSHKSQETAMVHYTMHPYVFSSARIDHSSINDSLPRRAFEKHDFSCLSLPSPAVDLLYQVAIPSTVGCKVLDEEQNDCMHHVLDSALSKRESMHKRFFVELNPTQEKMLLNPTQEKANCYINNKKNSAQRNVAEQHAAYRFTGVH
jgi:hypothetical protein